MTLAAEDLCPQVMPTCVRMMGPTAIRGYGDPGVCSSRAWSSRTSPATVSRSSGRVDRAAFLGPAHEALTLSPRWLPADDLERARVPQCIAGATREHGGRRATGRIAHLAIGDRVGAARSWRQSLEPEPDPALRRRLLAVERGGPETP